MIRAIAGLILSLSLVGCVTTSTVDSASSSPRKAASVNAELGARYLARGELKIAKSKLEKALEQDSRNAEANNAYAMLQVKLRQPKKAEEYYQRAISLDPDNADYSNTYGIFLCGQGRLEDAEAAFLEAARNPLYITPEYAYDNAALCALDAGQPQRAAEHAASALRSNPRFSPALLHMAQARFASKQYQLAEAYLSRFHKFSRTNPSSLWLAVQIARATGDVTGARRYGEQLLQRYPQSSEATRYLETR